VRRTNGGKATKADADRTDCPFCERQERRGDLAERTVYEDELYLVAHQVADTGPSALGVVLLQTKRHVPDLASLTAREAARLGTVVSKVSRALHACSGAAWTYCFGFTEAYRHVHLVIAARYPDLPRRYVRLAFADWPGAPRGDRRQVAELCLRLREAIGARPDRRGAL
jgi:histidine triad (HIT) family protein